MSKLNRNSNGYIFLYAVLLTLVCGTLLAFISEGLKDRQKAAVLVEKQKFILKAGMGEDALAGLKPNEITDLYNKVVTVDLVNSKGEKVEANEAKLSIFKQYKKPAEERVLPVYIVGKKENPKEVESYVLPTYGNGLWDNIWAFIAIDGDLETINGVVFDHKGETPGLGARITDPAVQARFVGKKLNYQGNEINAPDFVKGETKSKYESEPQKIDGLSGATITAVGVNDMLDSYMNLYRPYLSSKR